MSKNNQSILLVEDDFLVAKTTAKQLTSKGYSIVHAESGEKAIDTINSNAETFALILMDIDLGPGIDGTKAAEKILANFDIPILFLSSHTEPEIVEKTEKITSYGYVVKNSTITVLDASIKMAFKLFEAKQKAHEKEEALRKSKESYHTFIKQSHEAIYCTEFDNPIDISLPIEEQIDLIYDNAYMGECNQAMVDMYGLVLIENFKGQRLIDFHGGKDNPVNRETFRKFIRSNYESVDCETEEVLSNGEKIYFLCNDIGIIEKGFLVRIWGTAINITERKKVDAALKASEEKYRRLFETMVQGVIYHSRDGKIISANPAARKILGLTLEQIMGKTSLDPDWKAVSEDGSELLGENHPAMITLRTGKPIEDFVMGIRNFRTKENKWILVSSIPIFNPGETKPFQVYATFTDITKVKNKLDH